MAWELPGFCVGSLTASSTLAAKQFYAVKAHTSNNQVALCDTDGEVILGVVQNKPAAGEAANVMMSGVTKVVAAETLTAGDNWGTDANGTAKKIEGTITGADVGDYSAGKVLQGASAGELATVSIGFQTFKVEAQ